MNGAARASWAARAAGLVAVLGLVIADHPATAQEAGAGAKYVPAEGLAAYVEFDGLEAHHQGWMTTAAYRMLTETSAGAMLEELVGQLADRAPAGDGRPVSGAEAVAVAKHVARHGVTFGLIGPLEGPGLERAFGVLVLRGAAGPKARPLFERMILGRIPRGTPTTKQTLEGRQVTLIKPDQPGSGWAYWKEGDDFAVTFAGGADAVRSVIATVAGAKPNASTHPIRKDLILGDDGFEPILLAFADAAALPKLPPPAVQLGLDGIERIEYRWGFRGEALMNVTRVIAPAPRRGILTVLDQPTFDADSIPPLPSGLRSFTALSIDWGKVLDAISEVPDGERAVAQASDEFRRRTGLSLREDVLDAIGPRWAFYQAPETMQVPGNPIYGMIEWMLKPPKLTAVVEIRKPAEFRRDVDGLMTSLNAQLAEAVRGEAPPPKFEKIDEGYILNIPPELLPLPAGVRPTLRIGEKYAALAVSPESARAALEAKPNDHERDMLAELGDDLMLLSVGDPRELTPEIIANLPFFIQLIGRQGGRPGGPEGMETLKSIKVDPELIPSPDSLRKYSFPSVMTAKVDDRGLTITGRQAFPSFNPLSSGPIAVALLLPAVQSAREAARRSQCINNLKQIGLAMHNYHDTRKAFPAAAIHSKDGKPLLSWRVAILPYLDQMALYEEFHLDEPWDSEHNKALIDRMPPMYACPTATHKPGTTPYRVAFGERAMFEGKEGVSLADVTDGTSNTILVAESREAVTWTKPDELKFDPAGDPPPIGSSHPGGANILFGDGSVRFLKDTIDKITLRALFTRNGGEVIDTSAF